MNSNSVTNSLYNCKAARRRLVFSRKRATDVVIFTAPEASTPFIFNAVLCES